MLARLAVPVGTGRLDETYTQGDKGEAARYGWVNPGAIWYTPPTIADADG